MQQVVGTYPPGCSLLFRASSWMLEELLEDTPAYPLHQEQLLLGHWLTELKLVGQQELLVVGLLVGLALEGPL